MTTHELKTFPPYFAAVAEGRKTFEVRWNDRAYQAGDMVVLREWDPARGCDCRATSLSHQRRCTRYTGRTIAAGIDCVIAQTATQVTGKVGFDGRGYVVFSLVDVQPLETSAPTRDGIALVAAAAERREAQS